MKSSILLIAVLLNFAMFNVADNDFEKNQLKNIYIPCEKEKSDNSNLGDFSQTRSVYDYNPEIEKDDWNVFNSLFLLISIIVLLLMLVFINFCTMLCDLQD